MLILGSKSSVDPNAPFGLLKFRSMGNASPTVGLNTRYAKLIFLTGYGTATSNWSDNRGNSFVQAPVIGAVCVAYCLDPIGTGPGHTFTIANAGAFPTTVASAWGHSGPLDVDQPFVASPWAPQPVILPPFTTGAAETLILVGWVGADYIDYPAFDSGFQIVWAAGWSGTNRSVGMAFLRSTAIETVNLRITYTGAQSSGAQMISFK